MGIYQELYREARLHQAWRQIRARALTSPNNEIRKEALEFDESSPSRIRSIMGRLVSRSYRFSSQKAILKSRPGKRPRGILVAPLDDRIVRRAMLDVLNEQCTGVQNILEYPYSIGGIHGVDKAIGMAIERMSRGANWYLRSDVCDFFSNVPRAPVARLIRVETNDADFSDLFMRAMETELDNPADVKDDIDIFPIGDRGVAQGSALSPLIGNIVLHDFDRRMNHSGITCIRYIDDFLLLGPSRRSVIRAFDRGVDYLRELGLDAYRPNDDSDKASVGQCFEGFSFLGCELAPSLITPSRAARRALLDKVDQAISVGVKEIKRARGGKGKALLGQRYSQTLARVDRIVKGWGEAYAFCNRRELMWELDIEIDNRLSEFRKHIRLLLQDADWKERRRITGVFLLGDIKRRRI